MREELSALLQKMNEYDVDAYYIPTDDFHGSEYVGDHFECRKYISGFTGSAGTLLVTKEAAGLWTDGRYFVQAAAQLKDSGIELHKMGQPDVPTIETYIGTHLQAGQTLAFDGRCMTCDTYDSLIRPLKDKGILVRDDLDLVDLIWEKRPALSCEPVWILDDYYAGQKRAKKLQIIRELLEKKHADCTLIASLDDIAWLLNVRGHDVACTPVVLSYLLLSGNQVIWYVQEDAVSDGIRQIMTKDKIELRPYEQIYTDLSDLKEGQTIYYDPLTVNSRLRNCIPAGLTKKEGMNLTSMPKACKNPVEIDHIRQAHQRDGIAVTRFLYWLKHLPSKHQETEISAAKYLESLRREDPHYIEASFDPIMAMGEHGAIVHYSATKDSDARLKHKGFLLSDTGGHYLEGTTDITRTISMGPLSYEEKEKYTLVLKGHIDLASAVFLKGCSGKSLDVLARTPLWEKGLDFNHGTGHGVGYLLNVHEGPVTISIYTKENSRRNCAFQEGMVTSDEPGYYEEGAFGIRLENLLVCKSKMNFANGRFLCFEPLTLVPFDVDAILPELLTDKEKEWLNDYHAAVWKAMIPHMKSLEEQRWLTEATKAI